MVKKEQRVVVEALKELLKQKGIQSSKIVIFGSQTKRTSWKNSDIDIIVLSRSFEGKDIFKRVEMTKGIHRELVKQIMIPMDMIYCSPVEWKRGSSPIIEIAKRKGIVYS